MVSLASISSVHADGVKRAELDWLRKAAQLNSAAAKVTGFRIRIDLLRIRIQNFF
jgi:hypothetical protein